MRCQIFWGAAALLQAAAPNPASTVVGARIHGARVAETQPLCVQHTYRKALQLLSEVVERLPLSHAAHQQALMATVPAPLEASFPVSLIGCVRSVVI